MKRYGFEEAIRSLIKEVKKHKKYSGTVTLEDVGEFDNAMLIIKVIPHPKTEDRLNDVKKGQVKIEVKNG